MLCLCETELSNFGRAGSGGDVIETQFKLGSQKWKAKCRICRHEQIWQDGDVSVWCGCVVWVCKWKDESWGGFVERREREGVYVGREIDGKKDFNPLISASAMPYGALGFVDQKRQTNMCDHL